MLDYNKISIIGERNVQIIKNFIEQNNLNELKSGRYDISDDIYANITEYETKKPEEIIYESHKQYYDIQLVTKGEECVYIDNISNGTIVKKYDESLDYTLWNAKGTKYHLIPGDLLLLEPKDLHAPSYCFGDKCLVRKIVFKIKISKEG